VPSSRWHTITIDFTGPLPQTARGHNSMTVFADELTKRMHLAAGKTSDSAQDIADQYIDVVFRHHGSSAVMVSDRDARFTSDFWSAVCDRLRTRRAMSTAGHAQTDGQSERSFRTVKEHLRSFVAHDQQDWDLLLPFAEYSFNDSIHSATGQTPFYLCTGRHPRAQSLLETPTAPSPTLPTFDAWRAATATAHSSLLSTADKLFTTTLPPRLPPQFKVGDRVLVSTKQLQPDVDANRPYKKFNPLFVGPFKITKIRTPNAITLDLPQTVRAHSTFNAKFLKPHHEPSDLHTTRPLPAPVVVSGQTEFEIDRMLDHRRRYNRWEYLVGWKGHSNAFAEWNTEPQLTNAKNTLQLHKAAKNLNQ
jgi:hypothetical protein